MQQDQLLSKLEKELSFDFIRASGPGGQNVNKVATAVQLRFNVQQSPSLDPELKSRLAHLARSRINQSGVLVIEARRYRSQERNRVDAVRRFSELVERALVPPVQRRSTAPTLTSRVRRVDTKVHHGQKKRLRQAIKQEE